MASRDQVVACARSWINTDWQHQGRLKGVACDCAGLVIGVGREVFGIEADVPAYGHTPHNGNMESLCARYLEPIERGSIAPGDVVLIRWDRDPHHMAIVSLVEGNLGIIHANAHMRRVVEHRLDEVWRMRIALAYRFPGVA